MYRKQTLILLSIIFCLTKNQICNVSDISNIATGSLNLGAPTQKIPVDEYTVTFTQSMGVYAEIFAAFAIAGFQTPSAQTFYSLVVDQIQFTNQNTQMKFTMAYLFNNGTINYKTSWAKIKVNYVAVSTSFIATGGIISNSVLGNYIWAGSVGLSPSSSSAIGSYLLPDYFQQHNSYQVNNLCGYIANPPGFDLTCDGISGVGETPAFITHYYIMGFQFNPQGTYTLASSALLNTGGTNDESKVIYNTGTDYPFGPMMAVNDYGGQLVYIKIGIVVTIILDTNTYPSGNNNPHSGFLYAGIYMDYSLYNIPKGITTTATQNINFFPYILNAKYHIYGFSSFELKTIPSNQTIIDISLSLVFFNLMLLNTDNIDHLQGVKVSADLWNNIIDCNVSTTGMLHVIKKMTTSSPPLKVAEQNVIQLGQPLEFLIQAFQSSSLVSQEVIFNTSITFGKFIPGKSYRFHIDIQFGILSLNDPTLSFKYVIQIDGNQYLNEDVTTNTATPSPGDSVSSTFPSGFDIGYIPPNQTPTILVIIKTQRPSDNGGTTSHQFEVQIEVEQLSAVYDASTNCCVEMCPANNGINVLSDPPSCKSCGNGTLDGQIYNSVTQQCQCKTGFYNQTNINTNTFYCFPCYANLCQTCTAILPTVCSSCVPGAVFVNFTICQCQAGFYQSADVCVACHYKCLTCKIGSTCNSCSDNTTRDATNNCQCKPGFYDAGSAVCMPCNHVCKACINSTSCISCHPGQNRVAINGQCQCKTGFYQKSQNNGSLLCQKCDSSCVSCNLLPNLCTFCDPDSNRILGYDNYGHQVCVCMPGYSKDSNGYCVEANCDADPYCSDCKTILSSTVCIKCISSLNRYLALPQQQCLCKAGFYDLSGICTACSSGCAQCKDDQTCTNCVISASPASNGSCKCPKSYFFESQPLRYCKMCPLNCTSCISLDSCQSCKTNFTLQNQVCKCPVGRFIDTTTGLCIPCLDGCNSCTNQTSCNSCAVPKLLQNGVCKHRCSPSYYQSGYICSACPPGCAFCENAYICTICTSGRYSYNAQCYNKCPSGSVANKANNTCSTCNTPCETCIEHPSKCISCKPSCGYLFNFECIKSCPVGTYHVNGTCLYCAYNCKTCLGSNTTCTSCPESKVLFDGYCYDKCPYVMIGGVCSFNCAKGLFKTKLNQCSPCDGTCSSCEHHPKNCTSCVRGYAYQGQCIQNCPLNFYSYQGLCLSCHQSCYGCLQHATACIKCAPTYYQCGNKCVKTCYPGQFPQLSSMSCISCNGKCKSCSSREFCTSCSNPRAIPVNGMCNECSYPCQTCTSPSSCLTCVDGFNKIGNTCIATCPVGASPINGICQCRIGHISGVQCVKQCPVGFGPIGHQCTKCDKSCKSCINYPHKCTSCDKGYMLNHVTSQCEIAPQCQFGQFFSTTNNACNRICPQGSSFFQSVCLSVCLDGYKDNGLGGCVQTIVQTGCSYPFYLSRGSCVSSCPAYTYPDQQYRICSACTSNCFSCLSNTFCYACNPGFDLVEGICIKTNSLCPSNQFKFNGVCFSECPLGTCMVESKYCQRLCSAGTFWLEGGCYKNCPTRYATTQACVDSCPQGTILSDNYCKSLMQNCRAGQFYSQNTQSCQQCKYPCKECSLTESYCISCQSNLILSNNMCLTSTNTCTKNQYLDISGVCQRCPLKCEECVSSDSCSICRDGYNFNGFDCVKSINKFKQLYLKVRTVYKRGSVAFVEVCLNIVPNGLTQQQKSNFFIVVPNKGDNIGYVNQWQNSQNCITSAIIYKASLPTNSAIFLAVNSKLLANSYSSIGYTADESSFVSASISLNLPQAPQSLQIPPTASNSMADDIGQIPIITRNKANEQLILA